MVIQKFRLACIYTWFIISSVRWGHPDHCFVQTISHLWAEPTCHSYHCSGFPEWFGFQHSETSWVYSRWFLDVLSLLYWGGSSVRSLMWCNHCCHCICSQMHFSTLTPIASYFYKWIFIYKEMVCLLLIESWKAICMYLSMGFILLLVMWWCLALSIWYV